jgi:AraC-like DNA-binding protein/mannose-6-phosphate isomerase-like protein (cupin superfamily)
LDGALGSYETNKLVTGYKQFVCFVFMSKNGEVPIMKSQAIYEKPISTSSIFPVVAKDNYTVQKQTAKTYISSHFHDEIEFFFLSQGRVIIALDNVPHYMESDQFICILPGTVHSVRSIAVQPFFYTQIHFSLGMLKSGGNNICDTLYYKKISEHSLPVECIIRNDTTKGSLIIDLLRELLMLLKAKPAGYEIGVKGFIELILYKLVNQISSAAETECPSNDLQLVYEYIESNYMSNITIETLARFSNMSKFHFIRYFHKEAGQTPIEYINSVRINKACGLLKNDEDMKVLDIAYSVGFKDLSYFNRLFKRIIGMPPAEYRHQLRTQKQLQRTIYHEESPTFVPFYTFLL